MKFQLKSTHVALITSISLAVLATSTFASEHHKHGSTNASPSSQTPMKMGKSAGMMGGDMMTMMKNMHGTMHSGAGGGMMGEGMMGGDMMKSMHGAMHGGTGGGMMGEGLMGGGMMGGAMMGGDHIFYDTNDDGTTSVEELREALLSELSDHDADGGGALEIGEFELLHAARNRSRMVDRFQALDEDGDGQVTPEEMTAPAENMQRRMDRQAASGSMPGMQGGAMPPTADEKN